MRKRRKRAVLTAALILALALNAGVLTAAAEESQDSGTQAVLQVASKEIFILDPSEAPDVPAGYRSVSVVVDDQRTGGWAEDSASQPEFVVFYGKAEDGEPGFYRYDLVEKTIQRFIVPETAAGTDEYQSVVREYNQLREDYDDLEKENLIFKIMTAAAVLAAML